MSNESLEHKKIKEKVKSRLKLFGPTLTEYNYSGNRLDVFSVTSDKIKFYIEVIWNTSKSHFTQDMVSVLTADADIKLVIANPKLIENRDRIREYSKIAINQTEKGIVIHDEMINGQNIIDNEYFFNNEFKNIMKNLYNKSLNKKREIRIRLSSIINELKTNQNNLLGLFASGETDYLSRLFLTNAWRLYGVYVGNIEPSLTKDLIEIYNNLDILNEVIRSSYGTSDYSASSFTKHRQMSEETALKIKQWIEIAEKY
jgi:hypothetical protein